MSQYKQWLHYREIDQQLRTQLAAFEQELTELQEQVAHLEQESYTNNPVLQMLITLQRQQQAAQHAPAVPQAVQQEQVYAHLPQVEHHSFTSQGLTDPQLKVPWWLRNTSNHTHEHEHETNPVDQQSTRTNQHVQRWFNRWGHTPRPTEQQQED